MRKWPIEIEKNVKKIFSFLNILLSLETNLTFRKNDSDYEVKFVFVRFDN